MPWELVKSFTHLEYWIVGSQKTEFLELTYRNEYFKFRCCQIVLSKSFSHFTLTLVFLVVQLLSCVRLFEIPWTTAHQASLSFTIFLLMFSLSS